MKYLAFFLTSLITTVVCASLNFGQAKQLLSLSDSMILSNKMQGLGVQVSLDPSDESQILHTSTFESQDKALKIECVRVLKNGNYLNASCETLMDSTLSNHNTVTEFTIGAVGNVRVVKILN